MSAAPTVIVQRRHVDDENLDELLDIHLFKQGRWCYGQSKQVRHSFDSRCEICGAPDDSASFAKSVFGGPHPRLVPQYHVEDIITAMKHQSPSMQVVFELLCRAATGSRYLALTRRVAAISALQALGIVDAQGFVIGCEEGTL